MRNENRIEPFLSKLKELWVLHPDFRFGQLIYLIAEELNVRDIFFPEESAWEDAIDRLIKREENINES